ncbi:MAG: hypothetical protein PF447_04155 [Spirochaetaceae bacterium]|jgi:hypothetical protein|nr:hypothetical protein [Spirochaetaceae bacterium]
MTREQSIIDSIDDLSFRWNPVTGADFYSVYIFDNDEELISLFITNNTDYIYDRTAKIIPFDEQLTSIEIIKQIPFYRINVPVKNGDYRVKVAAVKILSSGIESVISRSVDDDFIIR